MWALKQSTMLLAAGRSRGLARIAAGSSLRLLSSSQIPPPPPKPKVPWKWVPPSAPPKRTLEEEFTGQVESPSEQPAKQPAPAITPVEIKKGVHLTAEEITTIFQLNGAENIVIKQCGKLADGAVVATARSSLHAKMLAELVVKSTRERRLRTINPGRPIEGEQDWFLVDTGPLLVHVFGDEEIRERLNLEEHFDQQQRRYELISQSSRQELNDDNDDDGSETPVVESVDPNGKPLTR